MSEPKDKEIQLDAGSSMDPFDEKVLEFDVHEYIWQHLNGADLLKASEVSSIWNKKVETRQGFTKMIKMSIASIPLRQGVAATRSMSVADKDWLLHKEEIDAILNSKRNYKNVELNFQLIKPGAHNEDLLKKFAGSIVDFLIDLAYGAVIGKVFKESKCEFPNLKILRLGFNALLHTRRDLLPDLLTAMPKLETLYVEKLSTWLNIEFLMLPSLTSLKEVRYRLNDDRMVAFFSNDFPNANFIQEDW